MSKRPALRGALIQRASFSRYTSTSGTKFDSIDSITLSDGRKLIFVVRELDDPYACGYGVEIQELDE